MEFCFLAKSYYILIPEYCQPGMWHIISEILRLEARPDFVSEELRAVHFFELQYK